MYALPSRGQRASDRNETRTGHRRSRRRANDVNCRARPPEPPAPARPHPARAGRRRAAERVRSGPGGGQRRAEAVAQGHAHARRPCSKRARRRPQPLPRLPAHGHLHARVGQARLRRAGLLRRGRQCRRDLGRCREQVARPPLARQAGPLDLPRGVRARHASRGRRRGEGRACRRSRRAERLVPGRSDGQDGPRLPGARAAAVHRRPLPAFRRQRRALPQGWRGLARDAARLRRLRRHRAEQGEGPAQDLGAARARLAPGRPDVEERQGQGTDRRPRLPGGPRRERLLLPHLQRRRRRRQRVAVRRTRRQAALRLLEARPVADRVRPRAVARALPALQDAGDRDRRPALRARARAAGDP